MLAGIGGSLLLLGFQLLAYLKDGFWTGISVLDAVRYVSPQSPYSWINSPSEWLGVHAILSAAPAAVAGLLGGLLVGVLLSSLAEKID